MPLARLCRTVAIAASLLAAAAPARAQSVTPVAEQPAAGTRTIGTTTAEIRLRGEPDPGAPILLLLPQDAKIVVAGRADAGFYPVLWGRLSGWAETGAIETPALAIPPAAAEIAALLGKQRALADSRLNVRAAPSGEAEIVAAMNRHEPAALTGRVDAGWVEVTADGETGWIEGRYLSAPGAGDAPRDYRRDEIIQIIYEAADYYGQSREDMLRVARCESDLTPTATDEVGGAYGLFQFKPFTWDDTPYAGYDIFDPRANAYAAAWMWSVGNRDAWVCQ
ncbi:MAG: SH3 domain-containing protein [Chloroflexota bacterium]